MKINSLFIILIILINFSVEIYNNESIEIKNINLNKQNNYYIPQLLKPGELVYYEEYELSELINICNIDYDLPIYSNFALLPGPIKQELYNLIENIHTYTHNLLPSTTDSITAITSKAIINRNYINNLVLKLPESDLFYESIIGRGNFGEVWKGIYRKENKLVVLKRLFIEKGKQYYLSGKREIHFGQVLKYCKNIIKYYHHFTTKRFGKNELWIVSEYGGISLRNLLYTSNNGLIELSVYYYIFIVNLEIIKI